MKFVLLILLSACREFIAELPPAPGDTVIIVSTKATEGEGGGSGLFDCVGDSCTPVTKFVYKGMTADSILHFERYLVPGYLIQWPVGSVTFKKLKQ